MTTQTLAQTVHALDIDLEESIIQCEDFTGMLMEWIETNCVVDDFGAINMLYLIHGLLTVGYHDIATGYGDSTRLSLVRFSLLKDRDYS